MEVTVDHETGRPIACGGQVLTGQCNQCGWCCAFHPTRPPGVPYPNMQTRRCAKVTEGQNSTWQCSEYDNRPVGCALFPLPHHETGPLCGFKWRAKV